MDTEKTNISNLYIFYNQLYQFDKIFIDSNIQCIRQNLQISSFGGYNESVRKLQFFGQV